VAAALHRPCLMRISALRAHHSFPRAAGCACSLSATFVFCLTRMADRLCPSTGWGDGEAPAAVGWEPNTRGRAGPRLADLGPSMDPRRLAESAVDLNLRLMRWRAAPALDTARLAATSCLLLGAGAASAPIRALDQLCCILLSVCLKALKLSAEPKQPFQKAGSHTTSKNLP
jgi:hypothetical protein